MSISNHKSFWVSVSFSTQGLHNSACPPAALGASHEKLEKMLLKLPEIISGSALKSQAFLEVDWFCFLLSLVTPWLTLAFSGLSLSVLTCFMTAISLTLAQPARVH